MDFGFRQGIPINGSAVYKDNIKYDRRSNYQSLPFTPWQEGRERQGSAEGATQGTLSEGGGYPLG